MHLPASPIYEFRQLAGEQFVLKMTAALVSDGKRTLFARMKDSSWVLPVIVPEKGADYTKAPSIHLESLGVKAKIGRILGIERVRLKSAREKHGLRANFVISACTAHADEVKIKEIAWFKHAPKNLLMKDLLLFEQS